MSSSKSAQVVPKKERTIRSETTKVFLVIFGILATVGIFSIASSFKGAKTFDAIRDVYLEQFEAASQMKQRALDIFGIFYLVSGDQDIEIQMEQMQRYDGLIGEFEGGMTSFRSLVESSEDRPNRTKMLALLTATKEIFDALNNTCREMMLGMMEGRKEDGKKEFIKATGEIKTFKARLDELEAIVNGELNEEANSAQSLLRAIRKNNLVYLCESAISIT